MTSAEGIWTPLTTDDRDFSKADLLAVSNYGVERSTGFPETLKAMDELQLTEKVPSETGIRECSLIDCASFKCIKYGNDILSEKL